MVEENTGKKENPEGVGTWRREGPLSGSCAHERTQPPSEKGGCRRRNLAHISVQSSALLVLLTRDITMLIISTLHLHDNDCVIIFPWSRVVDCGYISFSVQLLGKIVFHLLFRVYHHLF